MDNVVGPCGRPMFLMRMVRDSFTCQHGLCPVCLFCVLCCGRRERELPYDVCVSCEVSLASFRVCSAFVIVFHIILYLSGTGRKTCGPFGTDADCHSWHTNRVSLHRMGIGLIVTTQVVR